MKKKMVVLGATVAFLLSLSVSLVMAQVDYCEGNFDYDSDQDGTDAFQFKTDFGRSSLLNPCPPDGPSPIPKTGQNTCYDTDGNLRDCTATGEDGDYQKGVAWPSPRFTNPGNGTVKDNLTGLIWLRNANCFDLRTWDEALSDCSGLNSGECGLTDGSIAGDWRLPNRRELFSLISDGYNDPAVSNTTGAGQWTAGNPFTNLQSSDYWSSTTLPDYTNSAWVVSLYDGFVSYSEKVYYFYVWPVRGGH